MTNRFVDSLKSPFNFRVRICSFSSQQSNRPLSLHIFCQLPLTLGPAPYREAHQKPIKVFLPSKYVHTFEVFGFVQSKAVDNILTLLCSNKEKAFYAQTRYYPLLVDRAGKFLLHWLPIFKSYSIIHRVSIHSIFSMPIARLPFHSLKVERIPKRVNYFIAHRHLAGAASCSVIL